MAHRFFTDAMGIEWQVWSTIPSTPSAVASAMSGGWLTFLSRIGRKRLAPIPDAWKEAADDQLRRWCGEAYDTPLEGKRPVRQGSD